MNGTEIPAALDDLVDSSRGLLGTLKCEFDALKQRDTERLETLLIEKRSHTERVDAHWAELQHKFDDLGFRGLDVGQCLDNFKLAIANRPEALQQLDQAWNLLADLASQVWKQNRINGQLLELRQRSAAAVLSVLRGDQATTLYGSDGSVPAASHSRQLAEI